MSYELIAILVVGLALGMGQLFTLLYAIVSFREMHRIQRAIAGLVVQESENIQTLLRTSG